MNELLSLKYSSIKELTRNELKNCNGGELTTKQEVWIERGVAFVLLGIAGVAIYELGRING